jgi:hypothetical protein
MGMMICFCFGVMATFHGDFVVGFGNGHVAVVVMCHV